MLNLPFDLILTIISIVLMAVFFRNLLSVMFRLEDDGVTRKRLKSLSYDGSRIGQSDEDGTRDFLSKVSDPVIKYVLPHFKFKDKEAIEDDLNFIGWGKYMGAEQFKALTLIMRMAGVLVVALVWGIIWPVALILGSALLLGLPFFLKLEVEEKKSKMISEFPEIIRLTQGFLAADQPLTTAFENTLPYVADNWRPILEDFVKNAHTRSEKYALRTMKDEVNIPEVKELLSLISLSMDQGSDLYTSFENHHEKVRNMQLNAMMKKIHTRKNMAILVQYPMLLMIFVAMGLPTFDMVMAI